MIYQKLPKPECFTNTGQTPEFTDHLLLTEKLDNQYDYPEHKVGFGIISLLQGAGKFHLNRKKIILDEGSYLVVNKASELSVQLKEKKCEPSFLYFHSKLPAIVAESLQCTDEELMAQEGNVLRDFSLLEFPRPSNASMTAVLRHLSLIGQSCASFHALKADLLVRAILERLCRENNNAIKASNNIFAVKKSTRAALYLRMAVARDWIEENYHRAITLENMSDIAMMNSQHFLRVFKQAFQMTPHRYLTSVRLRHTQQLLITTDESVTNICGMVGFESLGSFSLLFRQSFGHSPSRYRRLTRSRSYPVSCSYHENTAP